MLHHVRAVSRPFRGVFCFCAVLGVAACGVSVSSDKDVDRYAASFGSTTVSWTDFLQVSKLHRDAVPVAPGESVYLFTRISTEQITLSNGKTVPPENCITASSTYTIRQIYSASQPYSPTTVRIPRVDNEIHSECKAKMRANNDRVNQTSRSEFVRMTEQAVKKDGTCVWLGYDRSLDLLMRSIGDTARASDDRVIFAKLRCG